jgi:hypothetical protein
LSEVAARPLLRKTAALSAPPTAVMVARMIVSERKI